MELKSGNSTLWKASIQKKARGDQVLVQWFNGGGKSTRRSRKWLGVETTSSENVSNEGSRGERKWGSYEKIEADGKD